MNPFDEYIETLKSAHMEVEFFKFQKAFHTHTKESSYLVMVVVILLLLIYHKTT